VADPTDSNKPGNEVEAAEVSDDALFESRSDDPGPADTSVEPDSVPVKAKKPGRFLAFLALLVALASLGLSGYLYYLLQIQNPLEPVSSRLDSMESEARRMTSTLAELKTSQADELAAFSRRQRIELEAERTELLESLNQLANQAPPSSREWKVAEVAYLLRIANHRLLMERDADGALELLTAADEILVELDDFAFYQVRARLAEETRTLQSVEANDLPGIYLELEALKRQLRQLPLKLPQYLQSRSEAPTPATDGDSGFWASLRREVSSKFRIRHFEGDIKPLLSAEEAVYLELNLRLMLERAQLAALRREQLVFSESLETAASWLLEYLDDSDAAVTDSAEELRRIAAIQLDLDLPDISASLTALEAVRRQ